MPEILLEGLALTCRPLGENDRLLTLLSESEGLTRLAVPGARRPRSSLAAAVPLAHLRLQVGGSRGLRRVRQLQVLRNYGGLGQRLETLAAAQALGELCLQLVPEQAAAPGVLADVLMQLGRLEEVVRERSDRLEALAIAVQGSVHLLALGGYALPLQQCARTGEALEPPVGDWE
ncbi:MAG: DNA repair protein RecO, partial [Synechococcaceae cyanobacterium ELA263]